MTAPNPLTDYIADSFRLIAELAAAAARPLSADKQRQVFLGIGHILESVDRPASASAFQAAETLRAADDAQMTFLKLLTEPQHRA